jgi:ATP-dependent DNA helicase 2 subunit 2
MKVLTRDRYLLGDIRVLQEYFKPSKTNDGDCKFSDTEVVSKLTLIVLSALAVAIQMIDNATKGKNGNPLKYDRRIIIVTDGRGTMDSDDLKQIAGKVQQTDAPIELVLLGVDFDDPDSGYKEENKSPDKVHTPPTTLCFC